MKQSGGNKSMLPVILASVLVLASCASTRVTSDWADPSYQKKPGKVLVVTSAEQNANLRLVEEEFVNQLKSSGVDAVPGYTVLPESARGDKAAVEAKARELGADAVLATRLVDRRTERDYVPGGYYGAGPYGGYYGGYYGAHPGGYAPGYVTERMYVIAQADLYDVTTGKPVWSAATETELHGDNRNEIKSFVDQVVKSLQEKDVIPGG
jgi:hypothetical protein